MESLAAFSLLISIGAFILTVVCVIVFFVMAGNVGDINRHNRVMREHLKNIEQYTYVLAKKAQEKI